MAELASGLLGLHLSLQAFLVESLMPLLIGKDARFVDLTFETTHSVIERFVIVDDNLRQVNHPFSASVSIADEVNYNLT